MTIHFKALTSKKIYYRVSPLASVLPDFAGAASTTQAQRKLLAMRRGSHGRAEIMTETIASVAECDIAEGIPALSLPPSGGRALILIRIFSEPIGMVLETISAEGVSADKFAASIQREFGPQLQTRFAECGLAWEGKLPVDGIKPLRRPPFLAGRESVMRDGPPMTVAICTRDRPEGLAVTLETLGQQEYRRLRIVVVDNAPRDTRSRKITEEAAASCDIPIEYVVEPRPGLSWARNRAIDASDTEVIAFVDDDERCDRWWAAEVARGFVEIPDADAVTGAIVAGELATESQVRFEEFFGIRSGRGFGRAVFSPATARQQSPMYPRPPFGAGGNMAFRRQALERIGRFDCALGAGTMTQGCEDTAALSAVLLQGGTIVYQPTAVVRHFYGQDYAALRRQLQGYGRGLTSFYTSMLVRHPSCVTELVRLGGQAVLTRFSGQKGRSNDLTGNFPRDLLYANLIGRLQGPFTYAAARVHAQRLSKSEPGL